ncbi:MAG: Npt1/Npt2 family nucleotide transporter [Myxococcota bacterium]|nr:Npt1/Npt2 family nucleotide transporter [Myxococcota bacterium]
MERFLRLFTDVKPGEGGVALLMFANVFLILGAYYLIKPLREGWIVISPIAGLEKMEVKAYTSFGQAMLLIFVIAWYSRLVDRWPRGKLVTWATLFCMSNMVVFWFLQPDFFFAQLPISGIVFYLWVGMFGVFVVAQFWAFAADVYSDEEGRRLIPMVAIGATAGAAFGAQITEFLVGGGLVSLVSLLGIEALTELARRIFVTKSLLLFALVPLGISIVLTRIVDERRGPPPPPPEPDPEDEKPSASGGLALVLQSRFLVAVAVITVVLNWVNTNGENLLTRVVQEHLATEALAQGITEARALQEFTLNGTTAFYGDFFTWVNVVALLLQSLVASRLLKYGGFGAILLLLPVVALASYSAMALVPVLAVVKIMKIAENATDYSVNNTARHVLWLPVPSEVKFKGKPTIDSLFARVGDGAAALTVLIGVQVLALATEAFFVFNVALVLLWGYYAVRVVREHRRLCEEAGIDARA